MYDACNLQVSGSFTYELLTRAVVLLRRMQKQLASRRNEMMQTNQDITVDHES